MELQIQTSADVCVSRNAETAAVVTKELAAAVRALRTAQETVQLPSVGEQDAPAAEQTAQNLREAARCDWSQYLALLQQNAGFLDSVQPAAQSVDVDWGVMLNWMPQSGKTLEENMQDLVYRYQELWRVITQNFSGAQQMTLLSRLEQIMMGKLELLAQVDLMRLYDFLAFNGQREAAESIRPSVQRAGFAAAHGEAAGGQMSAPAEAAPKSGAPQANGAVFASAGRSGFTAAPEAGPVPARGHGVPASAEPEAGRTPRPPGAEIREKAFARPANTFYTPGELRRADSFVGTLPAPQYAADPETEVGRVLADLDAGLAGLKAQVFLENAELSPGFAETMRRAMDQFLTVSREAEPGRQTAQFRQQDSGGRREPRGMPAGGGIRMRPASALVAERMSETYARTGNAREAVMEGVRYARELTARGESRGRDSEQLFWKAILFGLEEPRRAPMRQIRENWNQFVKGMDLQKEKSAALYFGAYESGGLQHGKDGGSPLRGAVAAAAAAFLFLPPAAAFLAGQPVMALGLSALSVCGAFVLHRHG